MHWDTQRYLDHHGFIIERGQALVDLLAPQNRELILDLGCGTGDVAATLAARGARVIGVDASAEMIASARQRFPDLDFRLADAADLPSDAEFSGQFDAVFSNAVLHWVTRPADALRGIARALKSGGRFVAEFGGHRNIAALETAFAQALRHFTGRDYRSPWYFPRLTDYAVLLEDNGFVVRAAWYFELPTPLQGKDGLRQWIWQFLPHHLDGLSEREGEAILAATEQTLRPTFWRDAAWLADYRRLRVLAEAV